MTIQAMGFHRLAFAVVAAFGLIATAAQAAPTVHRSCYDLDNDGVCQDTDPSIDFDDTFDDYDSLDVSGYDFADDDHLHVGLVLDSPPLGRFRYGVFTEAPGDIHIKGTLTSRSYVSFTARSYEGTVRIEDRTSIATGNGREGDEISLEFYGVNVSIGDRVRIQSSAAYSPQLLVAAQQALTIGYGVKIQLAGDGAYVEMSGSATTVGDKLKLAVGKRGYAWLYSGDAGLGIARLKMSGNDIGLSAFGQNTGLLRVVDSVLRSTGDDDRVVLTAGTGIELVRTLVRSGNPQFNPPPTVTP